MDKKKMKQILRKSANPVNLDLFNEVGFTNEELQLMKYLYIDRIKNQYWVSDELGISLPTLTNMHNHCVEQLISFFYFEKFKDENGQSSLFQKFFRTIKV